MNRISIILLSIFLLGLSSTFAQRHNRGLRDNCIREAKLNLTEEQKDKFNDLRLAHREYVIDLKAEIEKNKIEMQKLMKDDNLDKAKVMSIVEKNNEIRTKIQKSRVEMLIGMRELLTEEQREKFGDNFINDCGRIGNRKFHKKSFRNKWF